LAAGAGAVAGFVVAAGADITTWGASAWSALAAWVTAGVAVTAGAVAWSQLREARRLRLEQAQPYVVAYMEASEADPSFIDLVLRNFGTTAAINVKMIIDPAPRRSTQGAGEPEEVWVPDTIPVLVPGQEWRTFWDYSRDRLTTDLPKAHSVTVRFVDTRGEEHSSSATLDWGAFEGRHWVTVYGVHHAAKALRELEKTMKSMRESARGGVAVYVRDGDARDKALREQAAEFRAARNQDRGSEDER
jgi:hypothetical protein